MLGLLQKKYLITSGTVFEVFVHVHFALYLSVSPCTCQLQPFFFKYASLADRKNCKSLLREAEETVLL